MPRTEVFLTKPLPPSGIMLLLLCFFAFLHCWLNLFGELLQFADRMFYKVRAVRGVRTAISHSGLLPGKPLLRAVMDFCEKSFGGLARLAIS